MYFIIGKYSVLSSPLKNEKTSLVNSSSSEMKLRASPRLGNGKNEWAHERKSARKLPRLANTAYLKKNMRVRLSSLNKWDAQLRIMEWEKGGWAIFHLKLEINWRFWMDEKGLRTFFVIGGDWFRASMFNSNMF